MFNRIIPKIIPFPNKKENGLIDFIFKTTSMLVHLTLNTLKPFITPSEYIVTMTLLSVDKFEKLYEKAKFLLAV